MHDCSLCGCACYCHGDIDDCQVETVEYAYMHCDGCGCREDDEFYDEDEDYHYGQPLHYDSTADESEWQWLVRAHDEHIAPLEDLKLDMLARDHIIVGERYG